MKIIPIHFRKSKEVREWSEIESIAKELAELTNGEFKGEHSAAYAVHHSQVSEEPYNFFTVNKNLANMGVLPEIVVNPEILEADESEGNIVRTSEGCMSFPHRKHKKIDRIFKMRVRYQIPRNGSLVTETQEVSGIAAQIFQHELEHSRGENIFGFTE